MEKVHVERLDHLGVLASVSKDLGFIDMINARLVPDPQEGLTPGEAMAGMILNERNRFELSHATHRNCAVGL